MNVSQKEDYRVLANISLDETSESLTEVVCKVYVPKRTNESARVILLPNDQQEDQLRGAHLLGLRADLKQPNGDTNLITSNQALITSHKSTRWGPGLTENVVSVEPWDLRIETVFDPPHLESRPEGHYWLSRNKLLSNVSEQSFSFTGEVSVGKLEPLEIILASGLTIGFTEHSRFHYLNQDDTLMFGENVAELRMPHDSINNVLEESLPHLEDVLRLVSFVGEHRCVCVGWVADDSQRVVEFSRSRSVPSEEPPSVHDALVTYSDFADFLPARRTKRFATSSQTPPSDVLWIMWCPAEMTPWRPPTLCSMQRWRPLFCFFAGKSNSNLFSTTCLSGTS